jgi:ribosome-associated protein
MSITLEVRGEYIQLDQLLKTTGLCQSGGFAHSEIEAGRVQVDGQVETRKRAKLRPGQRIDYAGETVDLVQLVPDRQ